MEDELDQLQWLAREYAKLQERYDELERKLMPFNPAEYMTALAAAQREDGSHRYLSTSCLHEDHDHCGGALNHEGEAKVPTACKRCDSTCVCHCHDKEKN